MTSKVTCIDDYGRVGIKQGEEYEVKKETDEEFVLEVGHPFPEYPKHLFTRND